MEAQISDILKVVRELSQTVKKQTLKIKEKIEKFSGDKGSPQTGKGTFYNGIAFSCGCGSQSISSKSHISSLLSPHQGQAKPVPPRGGPVDLSVCDVVVKEHTFPELPKHLKI